MQESFLSKRTGNIHLVWSLRPSMTISYISLPQVQINASDEWIYKQMSNHIHSLSCHRTFLLEHYLYCDVYDEPIFKSKHKSYNLHNKCGISTDTRTCFLFQSIERLTLKHELDYMYFISHFWHWTWHHTFKASTRTFS